MTIADAGNRLISEAFRPPLVKASSRPLPFPTTHAGRIWFLFLITAVVLAPAFTSRYHQTIAVAVAFAVIGTIAVNLIMGVAGQAMIGSAAFMAIGAFATTLFGLDLHLPMLLSIVLSGLCAGLVGVLVGIPAMRVRGLYLIIATLALHYVALYALARYQAVRVGTGQFLMPSLRIGELPSVTVWFYVVVISAGLSILVMRHLLISRFGRAWLAIARDEIAAEVLGVNVRLQKVTVFGITSLIIGLEGALFAYYLGVVSTDSFSFDLAISYIAMVIIGGNGSTGGSVLGAAFVVAIPFVMSALTPLVPDQAATLLTTRLFDIETIAYGVAIIVFLVVEPRGLIYLWGRATGYFRAWPLGQDTVAFVHED